MSKCQGADWAHAEEVAQTLQLQPEGIPLTKRNDEVKVDEMKGRCASLGQYTYEYQSLKYRKISHPKDMLLSLLY